MSISIGRILGVCFLVIAFLFAGQGVLAQSIPENMIKKMPEMPRIPDDVLLKETKLIEKTPLDDEYLAYSIRVPNNWKEKPEPEVREDIVINRKFMTEIGYFLGQSRVIGERSHITIHAMMLDYEVDAQQWLYQYLVSRNLTIEGMHSLNPKRAEALYMHLEDGREYVVRIMALMNGGRVILVRYYLGTDNWERFRSAQAQIMESFTIKNPAVAVGEKTNSYDIIGLATIKYPESWELEAKPVRTIDRISLEILNKGSVLNTDKKSKKDMKEVLNGKILLNLVSKYGSDGLEKEIKKQKNSFLEEGLETKDQIEVREDVYFDDSILFGKVEVYHAKNAKDRLKEYELWLGLIGDDDYYYFATLLTPSRNDDYFMWLRNMQTYKNVLKSLHPNQDSLLRQEE